jgi:peptidyl-prolyl cis-trans isomerase B (cyclophilin B)
MRQRNSVRKGIAMVRLHTNFGIIGIELDAAKAPLTCANFLKHVASGHYHNTVFHRVIDNFMIQGGGFEPGMRQKPTESPIRNEADNGLRNEVYTVAMARTSDPHSATAQFFINVRNNDFLNHTAPTPRGWGYCVFGKVTEGTDVVDRIRTVATGSTGMHQDVPCEDVVIERVEAA